MKNYIIALLLGIVLGLFLQTSTEAQNATLLYAVDSTSGAPVAITTNGSNAVTLLGR